jgi:hypothetical protein
MDPVRQVSRGEHLTCCKSQRSELCCEKRAVEALLCVFGLQVG